MPLDELNNSPVPTSDWPAIDRTLLGEARSAAPAFPLPLLHGRWRTWVEASSRSFGSADYLANCLLAAVAGVCGVRPCARPARRRQAVGGERRARRAVRAGRCRARSAREGAVEQRARRAAVARRSRRLDQRGGAAGRAAGVARRLGCRARPDPRR